MGVPTVVVHDKAYVNGRLEESTSDWYAQDRDGNVWYFGEATQTYDKNGKPKTTKGSWTGGVDGAKPGIQMLADPQPGKVYRQEFRRGLAEDFGKVLSVTAAATVPVGTFPETVKTKDFTPLEPKLIEHKYYRRTSGSSSKTRSAVASDGSSSSSTRRPTAPRRRPEASPSPAEGRGRGRRRPRPLRLGSCAQPPGILGRVMSGSVMSGIASATHFVATYDPNFTYAFAYDFAALDEVSEMSSPSAILP